MKTNITIAEFVHTLQCHRFMDHDMPFLNMEKAYWQQWCFDDTGAHYIPPIERMNLTTDRTEEQFYETGKWPLQ